MPFPDHVRIANELVDAAGPFRKSEEMVIFPSMDRVVLHVGKGTSDRRDDPSHNARVCKLLFIAGLVRIPPLSDMWS